MLQTGRILNFNLTKGLVGEETLPEAWYRQWVGGPGLALAYLAEDMCMRKPLLDEPLFIMTGPLSGLPLPATATATLLHFDQNRRYMLISQCQGNLPVFLKLAGYDGLVISGRSHAPVRLVIEGKKAKITEAVDLWSQGVLQVEQALRQTAGLSASLVAGPAGEQGLNLTSVVLDGFSQAGFEMGAVLGTKNLKSISVSGQGSYAPHGDLDEILQDWLRQFRGHIIKTSSEARRASCYGCPQGCWTLLGREHRFMREIELKGHDDPPHGLPLLDMQNLNDTCLDTGLLFSALLPIWGSDLADISTPALMKRCNLLALEGSPKPPDSLNPTSRLAGLQGGYLNPEFHKANSIDELVALEDLVLGKSSLALCEHWTGPVRAQLDALCQLGEIRLDLKGISRLGRKIMARVAGLISLEGADSKNCCRDNAAGRLLPRVLRKDPHRYIRARLGNT